MFRVIKCKNKTEIAEKVSLRIENQIKRKKSSLFILPTGSTPVPIYKKLVKDCKEGKVSFKKVKTFNLDEYLGLPSDHYERYYNFMMRNLFSGIDINPSNINIPNSEAKNFSREAKNYEQKYRDEGPADLAILGIGRNGHIGFNEPGTGIDSVTHVVSISESTRIANSRFFDSLEQVPKKAITMGIDTIMSAKEIIIVITGKDKRIILDRFLKEKDFDPDIPATALLKHGNVKVYVDREAMGGK